jgi:hypothetical protein
MRSRVNATAAMKLIFQVATAIKKEVASRPPIEDGEVEVAE